MCLSKFNLRELHRIIDPTMRKDSLSVHLTSCVQNQRSLQIRWNLGKQIDLTTIKTVCPDGFAAFTQSLLVTTKAVLIG